MLAVDSHIAGCITFSLASKTKLPELQHDFTQKLLAGCSELMVDFSRAGNEPFFDMIPCGRGDRVGNAVNPANVRSTQPILGPIHVQVQLHKFGAMELLRPYWRRANSICWSRMICRVWGRESVSKHQKLFARSILGGHQSSVRVVECIWESDAQTKLGIAQWWMWLGSVAVRRRVGWRRVCLRIWHCDCCGEHAGEGEVEEEHRGRRYVGR